MRPKEFIYTFFKSLNPDAYKEIVHKGTHKVFAYFLMLIIFCLLVAGLLNLVMGFRLSDSIDQKLSKFQEFNVSLNIKLNESIMLLKYPPVRLDLRENITPIRTEKVLITEDTIYTREFSPDLFKRSLYKIEKHDITKYSNLLENKDMVKNVLLVLLIIALPSILVVLLFLYSIKYLIIIFIFTVLFFLLEEFRKRRPHFRQLFKVGIFASTVMIFLEIVVNPFFNLGKIPLILFIILFFVGIMMTTEKEFRIKKKVFSPPKDDSAGIL